MLASGTSFFCPFNLSKCFISFNLLFFFGSCNLPKAQLLTSRRVNLYVCAAYHSMLDFSLESASKNLAKGSLENK